MSLNLGTQQLLSSGTKYFSYSGIKVGDITAPATVTLLTIDNTGLRDSLVCFETFYGLPVTTGFQDGLGILISIDDIEIIKQQSEWNLHYSPQESESFKLFVPRQSKLQVFSLNTGANNTQERGCNIIGYYL